VQLCADVELKTCSTHADCAGVTCTLGHCPGKVSPNETHCDNKDNNCNGLTDESFADKGNACLEPGKQGICQGRGTNICRTNMTGTQCNITTAGLTAINEICNGLDDDCDGLVDEEADDAAGKGVIDTMVHVARTYKGTAYDYYIYSYEASRPDANGVTSGQKTTRACSKGGVLPWPTSPTPRQQPLVLARASVYAQQLSGFWHAPALRATRQACNTTTGDGCYFPYGDTYSGTTCNGKDYDAVLDSVITTGAASNCQSPDAVFDMSGNLKEWTNDPRSDGIAPDPTAIPFAAAVTTRPSPA